MFLLDTNVVSELRRPRPSQEVQDWVDSVPKVEQYLTVISLAEIIRGVTRHSDPVQRHALQYWLDQTLRPWFGERMIGVSQPIAETAGQLTGRGDATSRPISFADASIAATAIEKGFVLVTRNVKDFAGLPLEILNPWTDTVAHKA